MIDEQAQKHIARVWKTLPAQIKKSILNGSYRDAVVKATADMGLDEEGIAELQMEVLFVLLGATSVQDFEQVMEKHPALSAEQGDKFAQEIRKNLFAAFAFHLVGMEDEQDLVSDSVSIDACIETSDDVRERLTKLPQDVQSMIHSPQLEQAFSSVIKKYQLDSVGAETLCQQMVSVMVGLTSVNDFKVSVTRDAGIPPQTLDALFLDVEQLLFKPVRSTILMALESKIGTLPSKDTAGGSDAYRESV